MANQIVVSAGAKVRNLQDVIIGTSGVLTSLGFDVANGVPRLDVNGKILVSQLPNSVMEYKGTWNAATNTPTLVNGTGNQGDVYLCNVAGTVDFGAGAIAFVVGDQVIYSGSIWQRASGATGTVTSVAITESGDSLNITGSPITTSGTINIGFNGTNLQYVNGAGNLTTFPILTGYVPYTGATQDVDLGAFKLNAQSLHIKGTGGLGHLGLKHQSASATAAANEASLFADTLGDLSWLNGNLYLSKFITSGNTAARSYTFPNANGTVALTSDLTGYLTAVTATSPLSSSGGTTPNITIAQATTSANGYLSSTDWNTFNNKQAAITLTTTGSSGVSTLVGATLNIPDYGSALTGYVTLATTQTITGAKTFSGYTTFTSTVDITSGLTFSNSGFTLVLQPPTLSVNRTVTLPNGTGTIALTSDIPSITGLVPYTGATTNVDLGGNSLYLNNSQAVFGRNLAGSTSYALIGVNASNKVQIDTSALGVVFGGTIGNGTYTYTLPSATGTLALTSDLTGGTVTSVAALTIGTTGTDLSSTVATSTTTPVITLNVPTASATNRGALASADWTTFNGKQAALNGTGFVKATGTTISYDNTNYLPLTGGTLTGALSGTSGTFTQLGAGVTPINYFSVRTGTNNIFDIYDNGTGPAIQSVNDNVTLYRPLFFFATAFTFSNSVTATSFVKTSGTSSQFLKADGTVDSSTYQTILTNPVTGTGTTNYLPKFTGASTIGNSIIQDASTYIDIGGYALFTRLGKQTIINPNVGGGNVVADFGVGSGMGLTFTTDVERMRLTSSGSLGLGVTPSAWGGGFAVAQYKGGFIGSQSSSYLYYGQNLYFNGTSWLYSATEAVTLIEQSAGSYKWYNAPSGTAGNAITFTQAMTLTAAGRLLLGTTTESTYLLDVNGTGRFANTLQLDKAGGLAFRAYYGSGNNLPLDINLDAANGDASLTFNTTYNSGWKYFVSNFAARISNAGTLKFQVAPNGTAGNTISWVDALAFNNTTGAATFSSSVTVQGGNALKLNRSANDYYWSINNDASNNLNFGAYLANGSAYGTNPKMILLDSGNVGIGTVTPDVFARGYGGRILGISSTGQSAIELNSATGNGVYFDMGVNGTRYLGIYSDTSSSDISTIGAYPLTLSTNNTTRLTIASTGAAVFSSSVTATSFFESSDSRLKTLIQDNYQTKGIASITPKLYTKNGKVELGYYAQDFVGVLDSAISKGSDDMLSLSYREVHTAKIYALEQEIKELKAKMN